MIEFNQKSNMKFLLTGLLLSFLLGRLKSTADIQRSNFGDGSLSKTKFFEEYLFARTGLSNRMLFLTI